MAMDMEMGKLRHDSMNRIIPFEYDFSHLAEIFHNKVLGWYR